MVGVLQGEFLKWESQFGEDLCGYIFDFFKVVDDFFSECGVLWVVDVVDCLVEFVYNLIIFFWFYYQVMLYLEFVVFFEDGIDGEGCVYSSVLWVDQFMCVMDRGVMFVVMQYSFEEDIGVFDLKLL